MTKENKNDILSLSVAELQRELKEKRLSSREATEAYLSRIREQQGSINAYIEIKEELSLAAAEKADEFLGQKCGDVPALTGIPVAVKDNIAVRGYHMTCSSKMLENFMPPYDATVACIAGVPLGKTNLDEFAMGSSCEKSLIGPARNPLDPTRSSGGSSGGSAAAVAAYMAPWALGTDTGGSSRQPAAFCSLVSMKPTYGTVSRYGVTELASSMDTVCPMTRDVYDNALILDAISGRDPKDMTSLDKRASFLQGIEEGIKGLKIGLMRGAERVCEPGQADTLHRSARMLEKLGAQVELTDLPDPVLTIDSYFVIMAAECASNLARYDGIKYGYSVDGDSFSEIMASSRSGGFGAEVKRRIMAGSYVLSTTISGDRFSKVQAVRQALCRQMDALLGRYDAVLMPTASGVAFGLSGFDTNPTALYNSDCFTALANLTGHPAITLPCGGDGTLAYGAMLMGGKRREGLLYRIAYALEQELKSYVDKEVRRVYP